MMYNELLNLQYEKKEYHKKNCLTYIHFKMQRFLRFLSFFNSNKVKITKTYGRHVAILFNFCETLFNTTIIHFIIYIYLYIMHA